MTGYLVRRIGQALVVVLLVTFITFLLLHALPGGTARATLGKEATQAQIDQFNHDQGYDKPLPVQYVKYLDRLVHGDLGHSYQLNQDVTDAIAQRLPKTMVLSLMSTILAIIVAIPLGVIQAVRRNKWPDYLITGLTLLAYATPIFFMGLMLIILFTQTFHVLPPQAPQGFGLADVFSNMDAMILPVVTLAIVTIAAYSRYVRSSMMDNLNENYVRTARAKGLGRNRIVFVHTLRNALFPVITMLGLYLPSLFSGALVIESLFNYPGMGLMFWRAATTRDFPILFGCTLIISIATVIGALLADILYAAADPRVRLGSSS